MFHWFEQRPFFFAVLVFLFVAFAGIVEIIPDFSKQSRPTVGLLCLAKSGIISIIPANATNKNTSTAKKNGLCSNQ